MAVALVVVVSVIVVVSVVVAAAVIEPASRRDALEVTGGSLLVTKTEVNLAHLLQQSTPSRCRGASSAVLGG